MSSRVEQNGIISDAVVLPIAIAFGPAWLAWQAGKIFVNTNKTINKQIAEKRGISDQ